jgi:hypothetical protein
MDRLHDAAAGEKRRLNSHTSRSGLPVGSPLSMAAIP